MGAYIKEGMDYFPVKVDFFEDYRVTNIARKYGFVTYKIILKLLCHIWRQGYYLEWNECFAEEFTRSISAKIGIARVTKIVHSLTTCGYFDSLLFTNGRILSSVGIQEDYFRAVKRRKKKQDSEYKYLLIDIDTVLKSKDDSTPSKTVEVKKEEVKKEEKADSCQHNVDIMSDRREEKRREENRREEKRKEDCGVFASLTHTQSAGAHVCEGKSPKKHQIEIFSKELIEKPGWIDELKATRIASERFFTDIEGYMRAYCSWLFVTGADKSIETLTDFSRRFYYWISKHGNKLRPEELERKDSAEKKETSEERFLRMRKEMLEQERMEEESRFQNSIN